MLWTDFYFYILRSKTLKFRYKIQCNMIYLPNQGTGIHIDHMKSEKKNCKTKFCKTGQEY